MVKTKETIRKAVNKLSDQGIFTMIGYRGDYIATVNLSYVKDNQTSFMWGKVDETHRTICFDVECPKTEKDTTMNIIKEFETLTKCKLTKVKFLYK